MTGSKRGSTAARWASSQLLDIAPLRLPAATAAIRSVSAWLRARSICSPSIEDAVEARIWVSPAASETLSPAMICGRPALSTNTSPSSSAGLIDVPLTARSMSARHAATRRAVAIAPPGLWENSGRALPVVARAVNWAAREVA